MAVPSKVLVVIPIFLLGFSCFSLAGPFEQVPAQELVKYISEAKRRGVTEAKIKEEAVMVGWPPAAVDEALAAQKGGKADPRPAGETAKASASGSAQNPADVPAASATAPAAGGGTTTRSVTDDYRIGSGDTLQISVWREPEVSVPSVVVRADGRVTMPLIKEVSVGGLSVAQAEATITEALRKYITEANVTVVVATTNSKKVYVIGAVKKEGPLAYTYGMSVIQALSEAGGLTDYARRKRIYILRSENGREYRLDFNYEEVVRGERMSQNVMLLAGDTVVVPN